MVAPRTHVAAAAAALACATAPVMVESGMDVLTRPAFLGQTIRSASISTKRHVASLSLQGRLVGGVPRGGASSNRSSGQGDRTSDHHGDEAPKKRDKKAINRKKKKRSTSKRAHKKQEDLSKREQIRQTKDSKENPDESHTDDQDSSSSSASWHAHKTPQETLIEELVQHEDYYDILGVSKTASPQQIQKAYRRRAVQTHPDKLPDSITNAREAFDKVAEAYNVLSDDQKRQVYDRYGKRGLDTTNGNRHTASSFSHATAEQMFRSFFGGSSSPFGTTSGNGNFRPRNQTVRYQLEVSLEDLYCGMTRNVVLSPHKTVEVHVPKGMASGQSVLLSGAMDQVSNATPGDLIFVVAQRKHPMFTRKGHDLALELTVSLQEALCGVVARPIQHLDGRFIPISSARYESDGAPVVIRTGDVQVLKGEGMPKPAQGGHEEEDATKDFGDLYVQFVVNMPSPSVMRRLSPGERQELETLLAKLEGRAHVDSAKAQHENVQELTTASTSDFGRASGRFRMEQDDIPSEQDERRSFNPFGGGAGRQFYWSSGSSGSPFGSSGNRGDDDSNVQCQQM